MSDVVLEAIAGLRQAGVELGRGLTELELRRVEATFSLSFGSEHRELLAAVLPAGKGWVNWRAGSRKSIQSRLNWPGEGVILEVRDGTFWPASWGRRPGEAAEAERLAREQLERLPKLIPLFIHRCLPAAPAPVPSPVFSVYGTDVIYYGQNLADFVNHEFLPPWEGRTGQYRGPHIAFWSDLAEGAEIPDL